MNRTIGPLYANGIEHLHHSIKSKSLLDNYLKLFPDSDVMGRQKHLYMDVLHHSVYRHIHSNHLAILPIVRPESDGIEWHSTSPQGKVYFNALKYEQSLQQSYSFFISDEEKKPHPFEIVTDILLRSGMNLLCCPISMEGSFEEALNDHHSTQRRKIIQRITPQATVAFFQNHSMMKELRRKPCHLASSIFTSHDALEYLIAYCKSKDNEKNLFQKFSSLPFFLTNDDYLRYPGHSSTIYTSTYSDLYPSQQHRFIHSEQYRYLQSSEYVNEIPSLQSLTTSDAAELLLNEKGYSDLRWHETNCYPWDEMLKA